MVPDSGDPFRDYHRGRFWMSLLKFTAGTAAAVAVVAGVMQLAAGAPPYAAQPLAARGLPVPAPDGAATLATRATPAVPAAAVPTPAAPPPAALAPGDSAAAPSSTAAPVLGSAASTPDQPATVTGPGRWAIVINTTGYQAELDKCLWVRMDLGATAPIVGAHNNCGGSIVLAMKLGDIVTLSGTALDGAYTVIAARNAHAGDSAAAATSGWSGAVILQTCYFNAGGEERLLELERA